MSKQPEAPSVANSTDETCHACKHCHEIEDAGGDKKLECRAHPPGVQLLTIPSSRIQTAAGMAERPAQIMKQSYYPVVVLRCGEFRERKENLH